MHKKIKLTDNHQPNLNFHPHGIRFYMEYNGRPVTIETKPDADLEAKIVWLDSEYGFIYHKTDGNLLATARFDISQMGSQNKFFQVVPPLLYWKLVKLRYTYGEVISKFYGKQMLSYFSIDLKTWDSLPKITYKEAFSIDNEDIVRKAFEEVDVEEMIEDMGYARIGVEGKRVERKFWDEYGNETSKEIDVVYEVLEVNTKTLHNRRFNDKVVDYCVKCWCTTTKEAHYLWIEPQFKDSPLSAIASTCRVQKDLVEDLKSIKRQGDLFLFEYKDDFNFSRISPWKEKIPLSAEQYFNLLIAEA